MRGAGLCPAEERGRPDPTPWGRAGARPGAAPQRGHARSAAQRAEPGGGAAGAAPGGREGRRGGAGRGSAEPSEACRAGPSRDGGRRDGQPAGGAQRGAAGPLQDVPAAVVPAGRRVPAELLQRHGECGRLSRRGQPLPLPAWAGTLLRSAGEGGGRRQPWLPEQQAEAQSRQGTQPFPAASLCSRSGEQVWPLLLLRLLVRREDGLTWLARAKSTSCFFLEAARQSSGLCPSALSLIHPLILGAPESVVRAHFREASAWPCLTDGITGFCF